MPGRRAARPGAERDRVRLGRFRYRCAGCSQVKPIPPCSCMHSCAACTATCEQYALASATATGASGHVVGQAPGSRAGRQVRAVGDAAKGGLKPVLRGRGRAEAAQGLLGLVLPDPGLLPAGHLAGQLDEPGSLAARQVAAPGWPVRRGHLLLVRRSWQLAWLLLMSMVMPPLLAGRGRCCPGGPRRCPLARR
jgi:hypothetical protein